MPMLHVKVTIFLFCVSSFVYIEKTGFIGVNIFSYYLL